MAMRRVITNNTGTSTQYRLNFNQASLSVANLLVVNHNFGDYPANISIWDSDNKSIIPDDITNSSINSLSVDLSSYAPIIGAYEIVLE